MKLGKQLVSKRGVVEVMEVTQPHVGVMTRSRAMAIAREETADNNNNNSRDVKRRKLTNQKLRSKFVQTKTLDHENHLRLVQTEKPNNSCAVVPSRRSSGVQASCCSSTGSIEKLKVTDLEESVETGTTAVEFKPDELEDNSCRTVLRTEKTPPEAELEEFFKAAQKGLNERFKNKYNYDIVNDTPLKGRFEWIRVKPGN